jgi:(E)-4-hydroxy-3-methylbut-2-enyl-diphosphate synthase
MTNTAPLDIQATLKQIIRIFEAGADYVRISAPNRQSALNLKKIRKELHKAGFDQPLIADIHFNPDLALIAAKFVEKVRINPGNYSGAGRKGQKDWADSEYEAELERIRQNISPLLEVCKEYGTAIRIGTNFGSLSPRIISRFGNTPEGMVQSTLEFLKIFEDLGFYNTVISLKASNPLLMIRSYLLMVERMLEEGMAYPLHLGVTEAGEGENGRIKSALGISTLLQEGIGDTIRVSLSEEPEAEIPVARKIAEPFQGIFPGVGALTSKFSVKPFNWQDKQLPALPGGHKAIVISSFSGSTRNATHLHPQADKSFLDTNLPNPPDLYFIQGEKEKDEHGLSGLPNGKILDINSGFEHPLLTQEQVFNGSFKTHSGFYFFHLTHLPDPDLVKKLIKIPRLIILWRPEKILEPALISDLFLLLEGAQDPVAIIPCLTYNQADGEAFILKLTADLGRLLLERKIHGMWIENPGLTQKVIIQACYSLLQATGLRITRTEYISCPTCARTSFDLMKVLKEVKEKTSHLPGLKIAVMGCVVNGPGEMADADFGIMGSGPDTVNLFRGNEVEVKNLPQDQAAQTLLELINSMNSSELK